MLLLLLLLSIHGIATAVGYGHAAPTAATKVIHRRRAQIGSQLLDDHNCCCCFCC
jgi:hypothetical protein